MANSISPQPVLSDIRGYRHEVDVEPHAHPGEPRNVVVSDRETSCSRERISPVARRRAAPSQRPR